MIGNLRGIRIPLTCSDRLLLAQYIQGKTLRDWHITEWRNGVKEGLFKKEEFFDELLSKNEDPDLIFKSADNNLSCYVLQ